MKPSAKPHAGTQALITINSQPGDGTSNPRKRFMTSSPFEPVCTRGRILVVESVSVFREMQTLLLQRAGYGVSVCEQIEEALAEAGKQAFDVAVLTCDAPGADQPPFLTALRQYVPHIGLIFVTNHVTMDMTRELMSRGVAAVLQRPVNPALLMQSIDEAMGLTVQPGAPRMHSALAIPESTEPARSPAVGYQPNSKTDSFAPFPAGTSTPFPAANSASPFRAESASPFVVRTYASYDSATPFPAATVSSIRSYAR